MIRVYLWQTILKIIFLSVETIIVVLPPCSSFCILSSMSARSTFSLDINRLVPKRIFFPESSASTFPESFLVFFFHFLIQSRKQNSRIGALPLTSDEPTLTDVLRELGAKFEGIQSDGTALACEARTGLLFSAARELVRERALTMLIPADGAARRMACLVSVKYSKDWVCALAKQ